MKKKKAEVVEWKNLKVGDFIETNYQRLFCYTTWKDGNPACLGISKKIRFDPDKYLQSDFTRMKPTKSFVKLCKNMLDINLRFRQLDNLSYIEALVALKKYD